MRLFVWSELRTIQLEVEVEVMLELELEVQYHSKQRGGVTTARTVFTSKHDPLCCDLFSSSPACEDLDTS